MTTAASALPYVMKHFAPEMPYPLEGYEIEVHSGEGFLALHLKSPWPKRLDFWRRLDLADIPSSPELMADYACRELKGIVAYGRRKLLRTPRCYFGSYPTPPEQDE